ncbi:MAG: hypothetical protein M1835_005460 [Candelina submexicana]|nr:MAG: hypothetical protein M1835_005460 [Candelina submexicana]
MSDTKQSQLDAANFSLIIYMLTGLLVCSAAQSALLVRLWTRPNASTTTLTSAKRSIDQVEDTHEQDTNGSLSWSKRQRLTRIQSAGTRPSSRIAHRSHNLKAHSSSSSLFPGSLSGELSRKTEWTSGSDAASVPGTATAITQGGDTRTNPSSIAVPLSPFLCLPAELRIEVYKLLLVSSSCIMDPNKCLKDSEDREMPLLIIPDIDAAILRTCQSIYKEAIGILYQMNRFRFTGAFQMGSFATSFGDFRRKPKSRLNLLRNRLELIKSATLEFRCSQFGSKLEKASSQETSARNWRDYSHPPLKGKSFPHLRNLTLDFTDWHLTPDNDYFPKIMKQWLRDGFQNLDNLVLKGLQHRPEVVALLNRTMMKPGGKLTVDLTWLGFHRTDPLPASLLARYKEGIATPHNVEILGVGGVSTRQNLGEMIASWERGKRQ